MIEVPLYCSCSSCRPIPLKFSRECWWTLRVTPLAFGVLDLKYILGNESILGRQAYNSVGAASARLGKLLSDLEADAQRQELTFD